MDNLEFPKHLNNYQFLSIKHIFDNAIYFCKVGFTPPIWVSAMRILLPTLMLSFTILIIVISCKAVLFILPTPDEEQDGCEAHKGEDAENGKSYDCKYFQHGLVLLFNYVIHLGPLAGGKFKPFAMHLIG